MKNPLLRRTCPYSGIPYSRFLEFSLWLLLAALLVCVPSYLVAKFPGTWNALSQMLFQVVTACVFMLFGYRLSKASSEQQITRMWLRPAQTACNQIQVMRAQVSRLRKTKITTCDELQELIARLDEAQRLPIEKVVRVKCGSCKARLLDIQDHLSNAYETWKVFIRENCSRIVECDKIECDLAKFGESLKLEDEYLP